MSEKNAERMSETRDQRLRFIGFSMPDKVTVYFNDSPVEMAVRDGFEMFGELFVLIRVRRWLHRWAYVHFETGRIVPSPGQTPFEAREGAVETLMRRGERGLASAIASFLEKAEVIHRAD